MEPSEPITTDTTKSIINSTIVSISDLQPSTAIAK